MNKIITLGDLRELLETMKGFPNDTRLEFVNSFQEFSLDKTYNVNLITNVITIPCQLDGSILQGRHRVLGKVNE